MFTQNFLKYNFFTLGDIWQLNYILEKKKNKIEIKINTYNYFKNFLKYEIFPCKDYYVIASSFLIL